jgi:hypothetical protein
MYALGAWKSSEMESKLRHELPIKALVENLPYLASLLCGIIEKQLRIDT